MRHGIFPGFSRGALFVHHVGQHGSPQFALVQTKCKLGQVARKCLHVVIVVPRILAQIFARQLARRPCPVEWMGQQIVSADRSLQSLEELGGIHDGPLGFLV